MSESIYTCTSTAVPFRTVHKNLIVGFFAELEWRAQNVFAMFCCKIYFYEIQKKCWHMVYRVLKTLNTFHFKFSPTRGRGTSFSRNTLVVFELPSTICELYTSDKYFKFTNTLHVLYSRQKTWKKILKRRPSFVAVFWIRFSFESSAGHTKRRKTQRKGEKEADGERVEPILSTNKSMVFFIILAPRNMRKQRRHEGLPLNSFQDKRCHDFCWRSSLDLPNWLCL